MKVVIEHPSGYKKTNQFYHMDDFLSYDISPEVIYLIDPKFEIEIVADHGTKVSKIPFGEYLEVMALWKNVENDIRDVITDNKISHVLLKRSWHGFIASRKSDDVFKELTDVFSKIKINRFDDKKIMSVVNYYNCFTFFIDEKDQASVNLHMKNNTDVRFYKMDDKFNKIVKFIQKVS